MADITTGLALYWGFDEGSGTIIHDLSGNGHDASFVGTPTWTTAK